MENYTVGGTQVPFGDGTHVPESVEVLDESTVLLDGADNPEYHLQNAMKNIFQMCDSENTNSVPVSKLIDIISPFMQDHEDKLVELQQALDPTDCNVNIDSDTFFKEMTLWAAKIGELNSDIEDQFTDSEMRQLDSKTNNHSLVNGQTFLKGYLELGFQNVSVESGSYCFDVSNHIDPLYLQEQVRELDHQNRKLTNELEDVRVLLANSDDQIYNLQGEIEHISKKLASEQLLNDHLQKNNKYSEELAETSACAQKEMVKLQKRLVASNKEISQLELKLEVLDKQKLHLEDKVEKLKQIENETKGALMDFQSELNYKDQIIASLEETSMQLKLKVEEQQQMLAHVADVNEQLKLEKSKLEKNFREALTHNTLSKQLKSQSCSSYRGFLDLGNIKTLKMFSHRRFSADNNQFNTTPKSFSNSPSSFNTPTFLSMLKNPISPNISLTTDTHKNSADSDSPFRLIPVSNTSTPQKKQFGSLSTNVKCSPNQQHIFSQYHSKLVEDPEIDTHVIDVNLNIINQENILDNSESVINVSKKCSLSPCVAENVTDKGEVSCKSGSFEVSTEDEAFWKLQMVQHSPRESLESEMSQISTIEVDSQNVTLIHKHYKHLLKKLQKKISEYENIVQELTDEINYLKQQNLDKPTLETHGDGSKDFSQMKILTLQTDNHDKYLKIVELMEKTDVLQKNLHRCSNQHLDELNMYKKTFCELEAERDKLKHQLEILMQNKPENDLPATFDFTSNSTSEEVHKRLQESLQNEHELDKRNCVLLEENTNLKNEITSLTAILCKLNKEKAEMEKLSKVKQYDDTNKLKRENLVAQLGLDTSVRSRQQCMGECFNEHSFDNNLEECFNCFKTKITSLTTNVSELTAFNTEASRSLNERNIQISTLKEMINLQNAKLVSMQLEKSDALDKLYETKSAHDSCIEEMHCLKQKILNLQRESEILRNSSSSTKTQMKVLSEDFIKLKDTYSSSLGENSKLKICYEDVRKDKDELELKSHKFVEKIQELEEMMRFAELEKQDLLSKTAKLSLILEQMESSTASNKTEIFNYENYKRDIEQKHLDEIAALNCKICELENSNKTLELSKDEFLKNSIANKPLMEDKNTSVCDLNSNLKSQASFHSADDLLCYNQTDILCPNCKTLKEEIKELESNKSELKTKIVKLEQEIGKHKNFERLLTRIEKLKQRVEELEKSNDKFQNEINNNLKKYTNDKNIIMTEKKALEEKLQKYDDEEQRLKEIELEVKTQANQKKNIVKKNAALEEKLHALQREKLRLKEVEEKYLKTYKDLKKIQNEKVDLEQSELRDKAKIKELEQALSNSQSTVKRLIRDKNVVMKDKITISTKLTKLQADLLKLENENKDLLRTKNQEQELHSNGANIKEGFGFESVVDQNLQLQKQVQTVLNEKTHLECRIEQLEDSVKKYEATNMVFEKRLNKFQSLTKNKKNDNCEKTLSVALQNEFRACSNELFDVKIQLTDSNNRFYELIEHIKYAKEHLNEKRQRLCRSTLTLVNFWRSVLEKDTKCSNLFDEMEKGEPVNIKPSLFEGPLDDELARLQHQIHLTVFFLDLLVNFEIALEPSCLSSSDTQQKSLSNSDNLSLTIAVKQNILSTVSDSKTDLDEGEIECCEELLKEDFDLKDFATAPLVLPTITDAIVESLDLLHDSDSPKWSDDELEKKFSLLAAHFTVDIKSIQGRHKQQHEYHINIEKYFQSISTKLITHMNHIKTTVKQKRLQKHLSLFCQYAELIHKVFSKAILSAEQCGALEHEQRLLKCVTLMINYSAHLSKKVDSITHQLKSSSSPNSRKPKPILCKVTNSGNIEHYFFENKELEKSETNIILHKTSSTSIIPWVRIFFILFFVFIFILFCIIAEVHYNNQYSISGYPWDWISWEEILSPFIKRSYPNGPPPT